MKKIFVIATTLFVLASCDNSSTTETETTDSVNTLSPTSPMDTSGGNYGEDSVNGVDTSDRRDGDSSTIN